MTGRPAVARRTIGACLDCSQIVPALNDPATDDSAAHASGAEPGRRLTGEDVADALADRGAHRRQRRDRPPPDVDVLVVGDPSRTGDPGTREGEVEVRGPVAVLVHDV